MICVSHDYLCETGKSDTFVFFHTYKYKKPIVTTFSGDDWFVNLFMYKSWACMIWVVTI